MDIRIQAAYALPLAHWLPFSFSSGNRESRVDWRSYADPSQHTPIALVIFVGRLRAKLIVFTFSGLCAHRLRMRKVLQDYSQVVCLLGQCSSVWGWESGRTEGCERCRSLSGKQVPIGAGDSTHHGLGRKSLCHQVLSR